MKKIFLKQTLIRSVLYTPLLAGAWHLQKKKINSVFPDILVYVVAEWSEHQSCCHFTLIPRVQSPCWFLKSCRRPSMPFGLLSCRYHMREKVVPATTRAVHTCTHLCMHAVGTNTQMYVWHTLETKRKERSKYLFRNKNDSHPHTPKQRFSVLGNRPFSMRAWMGVSLL